jgi:hypothetical protein
MLYLMHACNIMGSVLQVSGISYALTNLACPQLAIATPTVGFAAPNGITVQLPDVGIVCGGDWYVAGNFVSSRALPAHPSSGPLSVCGFLCVNVPSLLGTIL